MTYTVTDPRAITRAESNTGRGDRCRRRHRPENLAGTGLLNGDSALYYAGTLDGKTSQLTQLLGDGATLAVTDTNRKQAFRWDTLTANYGETETPSENPAKTTLSDSPIELFPAAPAGAHTVASYIGAVDVTASSYGNTISYTPEDRAYSAIDDDLDTAWETGTFVAHPLGPVVAGPLRHAGDHRPRHPRPTADRDTPAVDHQGHPELRRRSPGDRVARPGVARPPAARSSSFPSPDRSTPSG